MREYSTPRTTPAPLTGSLTDDLLTNADQAPTAVALLRRTTASDGTWDEVTTTALRDEVAAVARGLLAAGVHAGDRVLIAARTRWEWTVVDYALWWVGAISVPLYDSVSVDQLARVLADAPVVAAVVGDTAVADRLREAAGTGVPRHTWVLDDGGLDALVTAGRGPDAPDDEALEARRAAVGPDDLATLLFTSGTTGRPRGCELTHGQLMAGAQACLDGLPELYRTPDPDDEDDDGPSTLLFLPLAHVLARSVQVACVRARVRIAHGSDLRRLTDDLQQVRPTFVLAVPRVLEQLFNTVSLRAAADGRGRVFEKAADTAIAWSRARERGRVPARLRARHAAYQRLVRTRLHEALGGRCRHAVCGGAPLGERLGHFYRGIGISVLEGYGLTETAGAVTVNQPDATRIGTVGRPLPGAGVRISDEGELLVRGPQVFRGYHGLPGLTAEVLTADGWLHTGDVGEVDDEGFVRVTGRQREIFVTAGGKNVAPAVLEDKVRAHPLVSQCLVVGDGRPYVGALVTLDPDAVALWAERHGTSKDPAKLVSHPALLADVQAGVDEANLAVSKAESVKRFRVLPRDWTEEDGDLTPSLKLRRSVVLRRHRDAIESLYEA
ncbi:Long-chain-fatty-acid--CoA ligase FadD15 [Nocardioides aquaticus]|uniref:Long-chain-fatty-acid--CoA ligase FadD15 n=1 Tax=Nocardioides aquaticus TaxID=160826 RepID=A0ABX8EKK6_9ACTN|nr:AMP-dependent synthetase/ligase [Nocardioides aquaticus]QVT79143.1 Long-chain-fatty-acid--CoA ligase FadD15 [Nocardioides aquaticus]